MLSFVKTIEINAPPDRVFRIMADVEKWPEWTRTVTSIKRLDAGPLKVGSRARVKQPKLITAVWTVTRLEPGRGFAWVSRSPGVRVTGGHWTEPNGTGTRLTLSLLFEGLLAPLAAWMFRGLNEKYLNIEAAGLKRTCEQ